MAAEIDASSLFHVPQQRASSQRAACQELVSSLRNAKRATLDSLYRILQESDLFLGSGPEAVLHLGVNMHDTLPVPTLDLRAPGSTGWAGVHARFTVGSGTGRQCGHFIARNLAAPTEESFEHDEYFERVRQHEVYHILQVMSGRACDRMTPQDMALCDGNHEMLPALAAVGGLPLRYAFELATRFLLQNIRNELEAYQAVDYPAAEVKAREGKLDLERWRGDALCLILRHLISPVGWAFVDTYQLSWGELVSCIKEQLNDLTKRTFLEEPIAFRTCDLTPLKCLERLLLEGGLLHSRGLDLGAFAQLAALMPRAGQVAAYNPRHAHAREFLASRPKPFPTLTGLEIRGLDCGCLATEELPAQLQYDIVTHWLGNTAGTWDYQLVETAPSGECRARAYPISMNGCNDTEHVRVSKSVLFREGGIYGVEVRCRGKTLARAEMMVVSSRGAEIKYGRGE